jgi:hypothetical protein
MSLEVSLEIREFLEQFFGEGNRLKLENAQKNSANSNLKCNP